LPLEFQGAGRRGEGATFGRAAEGNRLSHGQRKVMAAIEACRTPALGGHVERLRGLRRVARRLQFLSYGHIQ
jgi:hypothetical protein